jgi:CHAT domain/TIR domain
MADVFISYAREDHGIAQRIAKALAGTERSVWWDRDIIAGQDFSEIIERELDLAGCVIVLWSRYSVSSSWVRIEAAAAAERGVLVPALIENVKLPLEFRRKHTIDLTAWEGDPSAPEFNPVRRAVEAYLSQVGHRQASEAESSNPQTPETGVRFEDFVLEFEASPRGFRARVLRSPFGEGSTGFSLPDPGEAASDEGSGARSPLEIGTELYRAVFRGPVRTLLDKSQAQLEISPHLGLRLKIKIDPSDEGTVALYDLPWELLYDDMTETFFALSRQVSWVRHLDVPRFLQPIPFTPPLRVLAVSASPRGLAPLSLGTEVQQLDELSRSSSKVEVAFIANASAGAVREALAEKSYNVLHFMGHCIFDRESGKEILAFEGRDGFPDLVSGKTFATTLRDLPSLGVVVLNACNTASSQASHPGGVDPFRQIATALVLGGVRAVVAISRPLSDRAAIGFNAALYRRLAQGGSIDEALIDGRQAIHSANPESYEWATPVLFLRISGGNVFLVNR